MSVMLITSASSLLVHAISEKLYGSPEVPTREYWVWAQLPWCGDRIEVSTDSELIDVFRMFDEHGLDKIVFEVEE